MVVLAPSLVSLRTQMNTRYPFRSKASDGWIGDLAHSSRTSDHNPDPHGIVRAIDLTDDPAGGIDAVWFREVLRRNRDPRIKYVISEGEIFSSYSTPDRAAWTWGPYYGANGHFQHLHVSVLAGSDGYRAGPWDLGQILAAPVRPVPNPLPKPIEADPTEALYAIGHDAMLIPFLVRNPENGDQQYVAWNTVKQRFVAISAGEVNLLRVKFGLPLRTLVTAERDAMAAMASRNG